MENTKKQMEFADFLKAINGLKNFFNEQEKLKNVLDIISPSNTGVVEFGNWFVDDYIKLLEYAMSDEDEWINWFIFENDFGKKHMMCIIDKIEYIISNEETFYNAVFKK